MKDVLRGIWILTTVVAVSCGSVPTKRYYTLSNTFTPESDPPEKPLCTKPLVVASVMASSHCKNDKIVFRTNPFEIRHFNYRLWVSPPEEMMKSLLAGKLESSGVFPAVESYVHASSDHLALYARLNALEELDGEDEWTARMAMSFVLKSSSDDAILWKYEFDATLPAQRKNITSVVSTLSDIYNLEIDKMISDLEAFLTGYPECKPRHKTNMKTH